MRSAGSSLVRVATLNLWGRQGAWEARRSVLVDGLRTLRPDLVAFQEAITGEGYDQVVDVLGPGYHVSHQGVGLLGDGNHGASIASRWLFEEAVNDVWASDHFGVVADFSAREQDGRPAR